MKLRTRNVPMVEGQMSGATESGAWDSCCPAQPGLLPLILGSC